MIDEVRSLIADAEAKRISRQEVLLRTQPTALRQALQPALPNLATLAERSISPITRGIAACVGAGAGAIRFRANDVVSAAAKGERVVFVRPETNAEDVHGIRSAEALLTASGGLTSHAAVMARGIGRTCVVGCGDMRIDESKREITIVDPDTGATTAVLREGDVVTVDGSTGYVFPGAIAAEPAGAFPELRTLLAWADDARDLKVYAAASTRDEALTARGAGADAIGLCRIEQLWSSRVAMQSLRTYFWGTNDTSKAEALTQLGALLFDELNAMHGTFDVINVRLFDAPLADVAPRSDEEFAQLAHATGAGMDALRYAVSDASERWPAFGRRGARLLLAHPDFLRMQINAIESAAAHAKNRARVLIPFVTYASEVAEVRSMLQPASSLGAMLETPRACLVASAIAKNVSFVAIGFNDLTQATMALGRDDSHRWLADYVPAEPRNPFAALDTDGVAALVRLGVGQARSSNPELDVFFCGEVCAELSAIDLAKDLRASGITVGPGSVPFLRLFLGHLAQKSTEADKR